MDVVTWSAGALVLLAAAWTDARTHTIPDYCIGLLLLCGVVRAARYNIWPAAFCGLAVGGIPPLLVAVTTEKGSVGGGDVKLCGALGFLLGPGMVTVEILLALVCMSLYGLIRAVICRDVQPIPFAPFALIAYPILINF